MNKVVNALAVALLVPVLGAASLVGCGDDDDDLKGPGDQGGGGTSAGAAGTSAGTAGTGAGTAGTGGTAGTSAGGSGGTSAGDATTQRFLDLTVNATGFSPHKGGQAIAAALVNVDTNEIITSQPITLVNDDTWSVNWKGVMRPGVNYALDYYADLNGSAATKPTSPCDTQPTDHVWRREIKAPTTDTTLTFGHDTDWTDHCATFNNQPARYDLTFAATDFQPHTGGTVLVAVSHADTGKVIARQAVSPVGTDGKLSVAWVGLLEAGKSYNVDYYADLNKDGTCTSPPSDHVWRYEVKNVAAKVDVAVAHNSTWGEYCDSFNK